KFSAVDRMIGIAFQLFGQTHSGETQLSIAQDLHITVHNACDQPAARRTERTNAGPPYRGARHDPVFGNETNKVIFGIAAAGERRAGSGETGDFDELAPIHSFNVGPTGPATVCTPHSLEACALSRLRSARRPP